MKLYSKFHENNNCHVRGCFYEVLTHYATWKIGCRVTVTSSRDARAGSYSLNPILTHQGWIWLCLVRGPISLKLQGRKIWKNQVLPRGSCEHFTKFTQSWKTYHFIEKSILTNFSGRTRFYDALARIIPIHSSEFSLYRVCLQKPAQSEAWGRGGARTMK